MLNSHARATLYPAYCFQASPTYNIWVKLTAADVHKLCREPGFEGQNVYFHLNHPIRFIQLVGAVVAVDDKTPKFAIFTIDDGSGATLDVKVNRLPPEIADSVDCPTNTEVDNVNILTGIGLFKVLVGGEEIDVSSVVKVKGTISTFRDTKQLELKRVVLVKTTQEEASFWSSVAVFKSEVFSRPWLLPADARHTLEDQARAAARQAGEKQKEHREKWKAYHAKMRIRDEKQDRLRRKEEVMMNAGALPGTDKLTFPAYMDG